ncbi:VCBS repeat-containing protein [Maribacter sp. 2307ULW6-5]|uniref:VCBS repeat-containing protein n=1 Tax=Maribacter sp. 2307ULW6-5 TaxID=3386275 RepID=UPI0039BCD69C
MQQGRFFFLLIILFMTTTSCLDRDTTGVPPDQEGPLFRLLDAKDTGISFKNNILEDDTHNMVDFFYVYNGGGVAIGDINNDSLPDLYFTGNMVQDRLYLNKGNFVFEDISAAAGIQMDGWSTGATMVDMDNDGFLDIYVSRSGNHPAEKRRNLLFMNKGNNTFTEQAAQFGVADTSHTTQSAFFDYDKDGDLDLYLLNHTNSVRDPNKASPPIANGSGAANDRLYRNDGTPASGPKFTDVTLDAGILFDGLGLGLAIADIDDDGWEDVLVTNDFLANDHIYLNLGNGTFRESSKELLDHNSHFSMGNDVADFNNDGLLDFVVLDMLPPDNFHKKKMAGPLNFDLFERTLQQGYMPQYMRNTLQLNNGKVNGKTTFSEIGQLAGISATDWSWAPLFADFDNDGFKDLYITNGYLRDVTDLDFINYTGTLSQSLGPDSLDQVIKVRAKKMPSIAPNNIMYKNTGTLVFKDMSQAWGLELPSLSNGAAYADLDNDGDLDIVVSTLNSHSLVYENLSQKRNKNNFLNVGLLGDPDNRRALGTRLDLYVRGMTQTRRHAPTRGYQSSMDTPIHFGLGNQDRADSLVVTWPDGQVSSYRDISANTTLVLDKKEAPKTVKRSTKTIAPPWFTRLTAPNAPSHLHQEVPFRDFDHQFLLPHKHSEQGPGLAVADVNGDGLDDFFVGAGYSANGTLYIQKASGGFGGQPLEQKEEHRYAEDTGILFFDYDNDGDKDLYIASGSNEFYGNSPYYQDRLYRNDGKGNFSLDLAALPKTTSSSSCVRAADFDGDGDLDLFIGGRLTPLKYPLPGKSQILVNDLGKFSLAGSDIAPGLEKVGMVTDALWTDWDNDLDPDLMVVGEFMAIEFFENENGKLKNVSSQLGPRFTAGWWNSIAAADIDDDGDMDYVLGNLGLNTKYKISREQPLTLYALDYDANGSIDPLLSYFIQGTEYPAASRDDILKQIPTLKKQFPDYASFARASMQVVVPKEKRGSSFVAKAFEQRSGILENNGNGFSFKPLPMEAQMAPVKGILAEDFNLDGHTDLLLSGNDYGTEVGTGRYSALKGALLMGNGKGHFKAIKNTHSGLMINGNTRAAAKIIIQDRQALLFARFGDSLATYAPTVGRGHIKVPDTMIKAKIRYVDGRERIREFYHGSSYLSQSSNAIPLSGKEREIIFIDAQGKEHAHPL